MCKAADTLVAEEQHRLDLVFSLDNTQILLDVTTIDANDPSNGFVRANELSSGYFPGATSVIAAKTKWGKYRFFINHDNQTLVPFVIEVQ